MAQNALHQKITDPKWVIKTFNTFVIAVLVIGLGFYIAGFVSRGSDGTESFSNLALVVSFVSIWIFMFYMSSKGADHPTHATKVSSVLAWGPVLLAFPFGTAGSAWVLYNVFKGRAITN